MLRHFFIAFSMGLLSISLCFAKNLNLYEEPKTDAKVIGTIDPSKGIVPIFTPKSGDWIKIGDPQNGNVGWVKMSDLKEAGQTPSGFSFSSQMIGNDKTPGSYVIQFGDPDSTITKQTEALFKQIGAQQEIIQKNIQQVMDNYFSGKETHYPIIIPIVIKPQAITPPPATSNQTPAIQKK
ncbi:MAG: hypothetical protein ACD_60C00166G0001 [uncultured bacterium]|nr:MAG: hypothetical protein ACD_60C00166G0001 [uncultured bacterium]